MISGWDAVTIWDAATGQLYATIPHGTNLVRSAAWRPDGRALVVTDGYGNVRQYRVPREAAYVPAP